jgi:hypothetical protein
MKHLAGTKLVVVLTVIGALVVAAAAAASRTADRATTSAADQVRTAERTRLQAAVDGDEARVRPLLAPDFQLIDVVGAPETREDYLATIGGRVDFIAIQPVSPIKVRVYGNTAVARFQEAFEVVAGPDRLKHGAWTTDLFERRQGRWQLVWSQTTPTPNDPALLIRALKAP